MSVYLNLSIINKLLIELIDCKGNRPIPVGFVSMLGGCKFQNLLNLYQLVAELALLVCSANLFLYLVWI